MKAGKSKKIDTIPKMRNAIYRKWDKIRDNCTSIREFVYIDTAIREFKKIEEFYKIAKK